MQLAVVLVGPASMVQQVTQARLGLQEPEQILVVQHLIHGQVNLVQQERLVLLAQPAQEQILVALA